MGFLSSVETGAAPCSLGAAGTTGRVPITVSVPQMRPAWAPPDASERSSTSSRMVREHLPLQELGGRPSSPLRG